MSGRITLTTILCGLLSAAPSGAQDVSFNLITSAITNATDIAHAGDGRLFVATQTGQIRIVQSDGTVEPIPFLDISSSLAVSVDERGLLGLAFHPDYAVNGYFYVHYTAPGGAFGATQISRFSVSADPDVALPTSEVSIFTLTQPFFNHNAGDIAFGPSDGYLYVPLGDGGLFCDPLDASQDTTSFLGKILRIDVDGGSPYAIPPTNPFVGDPSGLDEIWSIGLRNPWRISFDRQAPHDLYIGDVGQDINEEISFQPGASAGGENYGWDCLEGTADPTTPASNCPAPTATCPPAGAVPPAFEFPHGVAGRCSVTGGFVYRGQLFPNFDGEYFLSDFCSREVWSISPAGGGGWNVTTWNQLTPGGPRTFGEGVDGELFVGTSTGIYRIEDPLVGGVTQCPATPAVCDAGDRSVLIVRDKAPAGPSPKDQLVWRSVKGPAEAQAGFGTPTSLTDYFVCLYGGASASLLLEAEVAPGGLCSGKDCWKTIGDKGYLFRDRTAAQDGMFKILLKGDAGAPKTKLLVKGKDGNLPTPSLPLSANDPVSVRVHNSSNTNCWGADFPVSSFKKNDASLFKARVP